MQSWSEMLSSHRTLRGHTLVYEGLAYWKQPHPVITAIHHNLTLGWLQSKTLIYLRNINHYMLYHQYQRLTVCTQHSTNHLSIA